MDAIALSFLIVRFSMDGCSEGPRRARGTPMVVSRSPGNACVAVGRGDAGNAAVQTGLSPAVLRSGTCGTEGVAFWHRSATMTANVRCHGGGHEDPHTHRPSGRVAAR